MVSLLFLKQLEDLSYEQVILLEFGSKVSISRTRESGNDLWALALLGNPYDGHTVKAALKQIKRLIWNQPEIFIANRGYKGQKDFGKT